MRNSLLNPICWNGKINPRAEQRDNGSDAQFSRFLDAPIKTVAFTQAQTQRRMHGGLSVGRVRLADIDRYLAFADAAYRGNKLESVAIEEIDLFSCFGSQDTAEVLGGASRERHSATRSEHLIGK